MKEDGFRLGQAYGRDKYYEALRYRLHDLAASYQHLATATVTKAYQSEYAARSRAIRAALAIADNLRNLEESRQAERDAFGC